VIKLGGSHAFAPHLPRWIEAIAMQRGRIVLVPGGGPFADAVRAAQPKMGFDERAAHRMALLAMEQYGCALASGHKRFSLADTRAAIERALGLEQVPVWLPTRMVLAAPEIPWSWDVTSDSLAAWLAGEVGAAALILVKAMSIDAACTAGALAGAGIVDRAFPSYLARCGCACSIVGAAEHAHFRRALRDGPPAGMPVL